MIARSPHGCTSWKRSKAANRLIGHGGRHGAAGHGAAPSTAASLQTPRNTGRCPAARRRRAKMNQIKPRMRPAAATTPACRARFADIGVGTPTLLSGFQGLRPRQSRLLPAPGSAGKFLSCSSSLSKSTARATSASTSSAGQLGYPISDAATVWIGRSHTPYGFVNTALHHGIWINDAVARPEFLMFEDQGGILPATPSGRADGARTGDGGKVS